MRVDGGELSGVKVKDLVKHYVGSRAVSTLGTYAAAYKRVVSLFRGCPSSGGGRAS